MGMFSPQIPQNLAEDIPTPPQSHPNDIPKSLRPKSVRRPPQSHQSPQRHSKVIPTTTPRHTKVTTRSHQRQPKVNTKATQSHPCANSSQNHPSHSKDIPQRHSKVTPKSPYPTVSNPEDCHHVALTLELPQTHVSQSSQSHPTFIPK